MSTRQRKPEPQRPDATKPDGTAISCWRTTQWLLKEIEKRAGVGSGVKLLDNMAQDKARALGIPFKVNPITGITESSPK